MRRWLGLMIVPNTERSGLLLWLQLETDSFLLPLWIEATPEELLAYAKPIVVRPTTMSEPFKKISVKMPTLEEDKQITQAAIDDEDALPLTAEQLNEMLPLRSLRGRPRSYNKKQLVSIRYSPEVLEFFKSSGAGWQSRMDAVLKEYVTSRSSGDAKGV